MSRTVSVVRPIEFVDKKVLISHKEQDVAKGPCWLLVRINEQGPSVLLFEDGPPQTCLVYGLGSKPGTIWIFRCGLAGVTEVSEARRLVSEWSGR